MLAVLFGPKLSGTGLGSKTLEIPKIPVWILRDIEILFGEIALNFKWETIKIRMKQTSSLRVILYDLPLACRLNDLALMMHVSL